jgi:YHS domain-containing protein
VVNPVPESTPNNNSQPGPSSAEGQESTLSPNPKLCACGCGHHLSSKRSVKYNYLPFHAKTPPTPKICACGCGSQLTGKASWAKFLLGHHRRKPLKTIKCQICGEEKQVAQARKDKFCSRKCARKNSVEHLVKYPKAIKGFSRVEKSCTICGETFTKFPHELKDGQRYFCSIKCATLFRENVKLYTPASSVNAQRKKAFATRPHRCQKCGYNKIPGILQIHHVNENKLDGRPENIEIICPNCHEEEHFFRKSGRFSPHKRKDLEKINTFPV